MSNYSNFWLNDSWDNDYDVLTGEEIKPGKDLTKLAATKRAISNFVQIVTGENIPVKFNSNGNSYTDGKSVVISSNLKDKDFDSAVGLALHEGSHIKLTNFNILHDLINHKGIPAETVEMIWHKYFGSDPERKWAASNYITKYVKDLLNIIEDRRIDYHVFKSAPGYKGYYNSMYDKYFNAKVIDKALASKEMRNLDWDSYMFRICNITNVNRDLNALPGFMDIWNTINLKNIQRLKNSTEALAVAFEIFNIVESYLPKPEPQNDCDGEGQDGDCNGEGQEGNDGQDGEAKTPEGQCEGDDGSTADGEEATSETCSNPGGAVSSSKITPTENLPELTDVQKRQLVKAIKKQKDFQEGDIKKGKLSKGDSKKVNAMTSRGTEVNTVGANVENYWGVKSSGTDCLVITDVNQSMIDSDPFNIFLPKDVYTYRVAERQEIVDKGLRLGTMLGRKLKIRSEEKSTKWNRLPKGKIDKRMIAGLGFGSQNVFSQTFTEKFNAANLHLSIDASGSMSGRRWDNALTTAVAIAKAATMAGNIHFQISFRTTTEISRKEVPVIVIGYDSRKDNISKIKNLFCQFIQMGVTPEGLCFEAIRNHIVSTQGVDSYFVNLSDGEPWFSNGEIEYSGQAAYKHTASEVKRMKDLGIKVLSYMIDANSHAFNQMYGKDARNINTTNLFELAKSLNEMFLTK